MGLSRRVLAANRFLSVLEITHSLLELSEVALVPGEIFLIQHTLVTTHTWTLADIVTTQTHQPLQM